jgi:APA family basic amino acid/polyamine antiporter
MPKRELSLFDSTCIIVGIIIGAGIYQMAPDIARGARFWWGVLALWAVGGLLSLFGALGYAELATAYPKEGGDYVYLSRAYGKWAGFLFGWAQLTVVRPGDIAVMAFAFATYARTVFDPLASHQAVSQRLFASAAVLVLTIINVAGVRQGKWTQNLLTTAKALGLLAIVGVAVAAPRGSAAPVSYDGLMPMTWWLALIFVLFTYGGWNEMAYVAAEVKDPRRNIVRALVTGTAAVIILYLLVNGAFLYTLGYNGLATSKAVANDAVATGFPRFRLFGRWHERTGTPAWALLVQGVIAITLIMVFGSFVDTLLYTATAVYAFYMGTSLAVIVLRLREPEVERPYRVTGYPVTTLVFSAVCGFLIYSCITYAWAFKRISLFVLLGVFVAGIVIYWLTDVCGLARRAEQQTKLDK